MVSKCVQSAGVGFVNRAVQQGVGDQKMAEFIRDPGLRHGIPRQQRDPDRDGHHERQGDRECSPLRQARGRPLQTLEPWHAEQPSGAPEYRYERHFDEVQVEVKREEHATGKINQKIAHGTSGTFIVWTVRSLRPRETCGDVGNAMEEGGTSAGKSTGWTPSASMSSRRFVRDREHRFR